MDAGTGDGNGSGTVGGLTSLDDRYQSAPAIRREISALLVWLAALLCKGPLSRHRPRTAPDPLLSVDPSDGQWQLTEILLPPLQPCPRPVLGCC